MKKMFKKLSVLKLLLVVTLFTGCGTAISNTDVSSEITAEITHAAASDTIQVVAEVAESKATTTTTTKVTTTKPKTTKKTTTAKKKTTKEKEYIVYKPSTHYIHRSTCSWVTDECYKIDTTEGLEVLFCEECSPQIKIKKYYVPTTTTKVETAPPVETTTTTAATTKATTTTTEATTEAVVVVEEVPTVGIDSYSRQLLAEIVWHEYGSDWVSIPEKARVAAGVMNRVYDNRFPNTVYGVLTQAGQFSGYWPGCCTPTQACYDAVDYYFAHTNEFDGCNSWYGTGYENIFYYQ